MGEVIPIRRRSPLWVRSLSSADLHAIAGRFARQRRCVDLTDRQEWLWDACVSELEYRQRTTSPSWQRCSCHLCIPPFPDEAPF